MDLAEGFGVIGSLPAELGSFAELTGNNRVRIRDEAYDPFHRDMSGGELNRPGKFRMLISLQRSE